MKWVGAAGIVVLFAVVALGRGDQRWIRAHEVTDKFGGRMTQSDTKSGASTFAMNLSGTKITDAGLEELLPWDELTVINLDKTGVTDVSMKKIVSFPNLTHLSLVRTKVADAGLKELAPLALLTTLNLSGTKVTNAGIPELGKLKRLTHLNLSETEVTDLGLKELARLKGLKDLSLTDTKITDVGLKELATLKGLTDLYLSRTKTTDAGIAELRKALPGCRIAHDSTAPQQGDSPLALMAGPLEAVLVQAPTPLKPPTREEAGKFLEEAMTHGLNDDGVPPALAAKLAQGPDFVKGCPLCEPTRKALEAHGKLKTVSALQDGKGLAADLTRRLSSEEKSVRRLALRDLVERYSKRTLAELPQGRRKLMDEMLQQMQMRPKNEAEGFGDGLLFCPSCSGACRIPVEGGG